ncbi:hypothetical protein ACFL13_01680 [Patescibacteria group bacterium]
MIYIVHGNDLATSRKLIINQQNKLGAQNSVELNISDVTPAQLEGSAGSFDIFGNAPFIIFDVSDAKATDFNNYLSVFENIHKETILIILSSKKIPANNALIKTPKKYNTKVILSETQSEANIFKFIDYLFSKNRRGAYKELSILTDEGADSFYILTMLFYGLRNVAQAKFDSPSLVKKTGFTKTKAQNQARNFSEPEILNLYEELYKIDRGTKTGEITSELAVTSVIEKVLG